MENMSITKETRKKFQNILKKYEFKIFDKSVIETEVILFLWGELNISVDSTDFSIEFEPNTRSLSFRTYNKFITNILYELMKPISYSLVDKIRVLQKLKIKKEEADE
jgi:hypothetical protein